MDQHPIYLPAPPPNRSQTMARALALGVLVGLILLVGFLGYEFFSVSTQNNQLKAANASLQQKADKLSKQAASAKSSGNGTTSTSSSSSGGKTCNASTPTTTVAQTLKNAIASYVSTQDYDSLQSYMANQVNVVIAGQEKGGNESSDDAVADMAYLNSGTAPWNFSLPTSTTDIWRAHTFQSYFTGNYFAGEAADNVIVSFQFDGCSKINAVFMANDPTLVEQ